MGDEIKRAVAKDDSLHFVRGADVLSVKAEEGKEPNQWKVIHFANVGTSEEFIETFSGEILELADGSLIFGEERDAVKNAIMTVVTEGLMPAFEHFGRSGVSNEPCLAFVIARHRPAFRLISAVRRRSPLMNARKPSRAAHAAL